MTQVATASTSERDARAGAALGAQIAEQLEGQSASAIVVFTSPQNDYTALLRALHERCSPELLVGCSSAGEFTAEAAGTGSSSAIAIRALDMKFRATLATGLSTRRAAVADDLVQGFAGMSGEGLRYRHRTALLFVDALAGSAEDLVNGLTAATGGRYRFAGGGAGDDGRFAKTHVFHGMEAHTDAVVALEILSNKPFGIGARHGWTPASDALRVTDSADACVLSLNVSPAVEVFAEHAAASGQRFDHEHPLPFFLNNIVGVESDEGHKLRVPLGITAEGGVLCAAEVPTGATAHIMRTAAPDAAEAAAAATRDAVKQVRDAGYTPKAALFMDCVATRLRLGRDFGQELDAVRRELGDAPFAGFNSYGQIVRAEGQFSGFHNCTAVVMVVPD